MKTVVPTIRMLAYAVLAAAALCAPITHAATRALVERSAMSTLSPRLQAIFRQTRVMCFGRFLIDVPIGAEVIFGPTVAEFAIDYYPDQGERLPVALADQVAENEKQRDLFITSKVEDYPLFGKVINGDLPGQKIAFGTNDNLSYSVQSFWKVGNDLVVQQSSRLPGKKPEIDHYIHLFNKVATRLRKRSADEIPSVPGSCIDGAFIPGELEREVVRMGLRLPAFPDVHFSVEVRKNGKDLVESSALEPLYEGARAQAQKDGVGKVFDRIKTLRKGTRNLKNWSGFEIAVRKPAYLDDSDAHEFHFVSLGKVNAPLQPQLDVQLDTGGKKNRKAGKRPSITDEEALALWDKLIESIRIRPTSQNGATEADPPKVQLGKLSATGETCTQSGWWQCVEEMPIIGGRQQHFKVGDTFPHATVQPTKTTWQKLKREETSAVTLTAWKLVRYDGLG